jgi:hypothetical protein
VGQRSHAQATSTPSLCHTANTHPPTSKLPSAHCELSGYSALHAGAACQGWLRLARRRGGPLRAPLAAFRRLLIHSLSLSLRCRRLAGPIDYEPRRSESREQHRGAPFVCKRSLGTTEWRASDSESRAQLQVRTAFKLRCTHGSAYGSRPSVHTSHVVEFRLQLAYHRARTENCHACVTGSCDDVPRVFARPSDRLDPVDKVHNHIGDPENKQRRPGC